MQNELKDDAKKTKSDSDVNQIKFGRYEGYWVDNDNTEYQTVIIDDKFFYPFDPKKYPNSVEGFLIWRWKEKRASNHIINGIEKVRGYYDPQNNILNCIGFELTDDLTKDTENYMGLCSYKINLYQNLNKEYTINAPTDYGLMTLKKVATSLDIFNSFQNNNYFSNKSCYSCPPDELVNIIIDYLHFYDGPSIKQQNINQITSKWRKWHHRCSNMFNMFLRRSDKQLWYLVKDLDYCHVKEIDFNQDWCDIKSAFMKCGEEKQIIIKIKIIRYMLQNKQNNMFNIHIGQHNKILKLKQKISKHLSIHYNQIFNQNLRLLLEGYTLKNNKMISDYFIKDGDVVYLLQSNSMKTNPQNDVNIKWRNDTDLVNISHGCYSNVICPKCGMYACLTKPILVFAYLFSNNNNQTLNELITESKKQHISNSCLMHCDIKGCKTKHIKPKHYIYHCSNSRIHPNGLNICQSCARLIDSPFKYLKDIENNNHILSLQLDEMCSTFFVKYHELITNIVLKKDDKKQQQPNIEIVNMNNREYVRVQSKTNTNTNTAVPLMLKSRYDAIQKEKFMTFKELMDIVCNTNSVFRRKMASIIQNPRVIREILEKCFPKLMKANLWVRKLVNESFEHIECRSYAQKRIINNLNDLIDTINDIKMEKQIVFENKNKLIHLNILKQTFMILTPKSPKWINNDKIKNCETCGTSFGIFTKKIHCAACSEVYCKKHCLVKKCYPNKQLIGNHGSNIILELALCTQCNSKYLYYSWKPFPK